MFIKGVRSLMELVLVVLGLYMAAPGLVDLVDMAYTYTPEQPVQSIQSLVLLWVFIVLVVIVMVTKGIRVMAAGTVKGFKQSRFTEYVCFGLLFTGVSTLTMIHNDSLFWLVIGWQLSWIGVSFIRTKQKAERDSDAVNVQTDTDTKPSDTSAGS